MAKHTTCDVCGVSCSHDFYHIQVRSSDQTTLNVNKHLCRTHAEMFVEQLEYPMLPPLANEGELKNA
jgi:hypothetical protein